METQRHKLLYYKDNTFYAEVEHNSEGLFLHCEVFDWKLSSLKRMYIVFNAILEEVKNKGFTRLMTVTPNPRFAKLFGGTVEQELFINEIRHEVIVWEVVH